MKKNRDRSILITKNVGNCPKTLVQILNQLIFEKSASINHYAKLLIVPITADENSKTSSRQDAP